MALKPRHALSVNSRADEVIEKNVSRRRHHLLRSDRQMTRILNGTITCGVKTASEHLPRLLPVFAQQYDELRDAYPGTINVLLDETFDLTIDFKTDPFPFEFGSMHRVEFVRVQFEYPLRTIVDARAWIYQPYGWYWGRGEKSLVEVLISKKLPDVVVGQRCGIHVLNTWWGSSSTSVHYLKDHRN